MIGASRPCRPSRARGALPRNAASVLIPRFATIVGGLGISVERVAFGSCNDGGAHGSDWSTQDCFDT